MRAAYRSRACPLDGRSGARPRWLLEGLAPGAAVRLPAIVLLVLAVTHPALVENVRAATSIPESLVLLPLQDRTGDPEAATLMEEALREELAARHRLTPVAPDRVRGSLRQLRLRDSGTIPPGQVQRLAEALDAQGFLSATLHVAEPAGVPLVALSGRLVVAGAPSLSWAGFEAASGLDQVKWLERGRVDDLKILERRIARRLVDDLLDGSSAVRPYGGRPAASVFLRRPLSTAGIGKVAVIPFDAVSGIGGGEAAGRITELALAVLHRRGASLALPGMVDEILRQREVRTRGGIDASTRAAIGAVTGARVLFTGTVETFGVHQKSAGPEPEVAFSARLVDVETGQILWMGGQDRRGWDHQGLFGLERVYSPEALADDMMESLLASMTAPLSSPKTGRMGP